MSDRITIPTTGTISEELPTDGPTPSVTLTIHGDAPPRAVIVEHPYEPEITRTREGNLADRLRLLADLVAAATADERDRWADGYDEFVDRMIDTGAIGDREAIPDPRAESPSVTT